MSNSIGFFLCVFCILAAILNTYQYLQSHFLPCLVVAIANVLAVAVATITFYATKEPS